MSFWGVFKIDEFAVEFGNRSNFGDLIGEIRLEIYKASLHMTRLSDEFYKF
jgi:hypothetical protein